MKLLLLVAFAALVAAQTPIPTPAPSLVWEDLYSPPYAGLPEISMGIGCVDPTLCYLPGGSNGQGFGMYSFNGQPNAMLNLMTEPNMTMMIMTTAVGGTKAAPVGAFAGFGLLTVSAPLQYLASNGTEWLPSTTPPEFIFVIQSMRATHDGAHMIALGTGPSGSAMMHSTDGGKSFKSLPFNVSLINKNCTAPMYAAMVDEKTWYVTLGSSPQSNSQSGSHSHSSSSGMHSEVIRREGLTSKIVRLEDGRIRRTVHSAFEGLHELRNEECPGFTGQIAKTIDGGKTWVNLLAESTYSFAEIDCVSATHCVAVGFGADAQGNPISKIVLTTDGTTFKDVLVLNGTQTQMYSFQAVRFVDHIEAWVGGGFSNAAGNSGAFWYTKDGGHTWKMYPNLQPNVMMIMDMDFTKGVGYAVAMTNLKTATVLRYKKQHYDGFFVQSQCPFAGCTVLCQNMSFPQGFCIQAQGGSVMAFCDDNEIIQQNYQTTSCIGSFSISTMTINQCLNSTQGGFFENYCPKGQAHPQLLRAAEKHNLRN